MKNIIITKKIWSKKNFDILKKNFLILSKVDLKKLNFQIQKLFFYSLVKIN